MTEKKPFVHGRKLKVAWVIASRVSGGIGPVCYYTASACGRLRLCEPLLVPVHDTGDSRIEAETGLSISPLGLGADPVSGFLSWMDHTKPDVVITNDISTLEPAYSELPSGVLHIVQLHDTGKTYLRAVQKGLPHANGAICVARNVEERLRRFLGATAARYPITTIYNGAEFPEFKRTQAEPGLLRLLYTGRIDNLVKGTSDLLPLARGLQKRGIRFRLSIAGGIDPVLRAAFSRAGLGDCVRWLGWVPHTQCWEVYGSNDILLMPSRREPFGMVTIEAMSMGCVPMAYDIASGSQEIIEDGRSGILVPLGDYDRWVELVGELSADAMLLSRLSAGAVARARSGFECTRQAAATMAFVQKCATERPDRMVKQERNGGGPPAQRKRRLGLRYASLPIDLRLRLRAWIGRSPRLSRFLLEHVI